MVFKPVYIFILYFTIVIDYFAGLLIEKAKGKQRKLFLIISLISNIGILAFFKYHNFFNENLTVLTSFLGYHNQIPFLDMVLPIGLSFHTFQAMSYTIEVYRGKFPAERKFYLYSLYVMFYPQLVAGPIERPQNVLPQLKQFHKFSWQNLKLGLLMIAFGLFKKVVIADRLALYVDEVYDSPGSFSRGSILLAIVFYSFQIYCDFSGYSQIALGTAKVMGYDLMKNFDQPYLSKSISEFWRRWHISLSSWFRDYVYIGFGGNKHGFKRQAIALLLVFTLSGLWHGASWAFIMWGMLHGIMVVWSNYYNKINKGILKENPFANGIKILFTFAIVTLIWIPFRAGTISKTIEIVKSMFNNMTTSKYPEAYNFNEFLFIFTLIPLLLIVEKYSKKLLPKKNNMVWLLILLIMASCYFLGVFDQQQFIYFQF